MLSYYFSFQDLYISAQQDEGTFVNLKSFFRFLLNGMKFGFKKFGFHLIRLLNGFYAFLLALTDY